MLRIFSPLLLILGCLACGSATAKELTVAFELPDFDISDYRKPYVAIWKENASGNETLLLWHLTKRKEDKWLVDIRRWWRKLGRYGDAPDALTGATRGPGKYREKFEVSDSAPFVLYVEVVREDGGRSLLKQKIDFSNGPSVYSLPADKEIGELTITVGKH